jgi:PIN domain nuclease of toxin-antitoxin system
MELLLDTHTFIWWSIAQERLSSKVSSLLSSTSNKIFLSTASAWEIQIKLQLGKLRLNISPVELIKNQITINGLQILPIDLEHIWKLAVLEHHHRDPFDRILIAQSISEGMPILSIDKVFDLYPVQKIW